MYGTYIKQEEINKSNYLTPGLNTDVSLVGWSLSSTENGKALNILLSKNGNETRQTVFEYNPEYARPLLDRKTKEPIETKEEAAARELTIFSSYIGSWIVAFIGEEKYQEELAKANPTDFESFVNFCKGLLPEDFATRKGFLVCQYNTKGYIDCFTNPVRQWWIIGRKPPFTLNEKEAKSIDLSKINYTKTNTGDTSSAPQATNW